MNQISARVRARVRGCWLNYQLSNFQDVMIDDAMDHAVGKNAYKSSNTSTELTTNDNLFTILCSGARVMCMVNNCGCANMVEANKTLIWNIPDEWTFEEAATVPVAYGTVYYAMVSVS